MKEKQEKGETTAWVNLSGTEVNIQLSDSALKTTVEKNHQGWPKLGVNFLLLIWVTFLLNAQIRT